MFKNLRVTLLAFTIGLFISFATVAMAADGTIKYFGPYAGYFYLNQAHVYSTSGYGAWGSAETCTQSGTAPTGYMGISTYLYNYAGYCVTYTPFVYNPSPSAGIGRITDYYNVSGTNYRCRGQSAVYNGDTYDYVYTNYTPWLYY